MEPVKEKSPKSNDLVESYLLAAFHVHSIHVISILLAVDRVCGSVSTCLLAVNYFKALQKNGR